MIRYSTRWGRHSRVSMPGWLALCIGLLSFGIGLYVWFAKAVIITAIFCAKTTAKAYRSGSRYLRDQAALRDTGR